MAAVAPVAAVAAVAPVARAPAVTPVATTIVASSPPVQPPPKAPAIKQSVIDVPAHQKRVVQSPYDLVSLFMNRMDVLKSYDWDYALKAAPNTAEKGISQIISKIEEGFEELKKYKKK